MKVAVVLEHRFTMARDGNLRAVGTFGEGFWRRYLECYDEVTIVARVAQASDLRGSLKVPDEGLHVQPIPAYVGPLQFFHRLAVVISMLWRVSGCSDLVIIRGPSTLGNLLVPFLRLRRVPFAVEVVGDPADVFATRANPIVWLYRQWFTRSLAMQCRVAVGAAYVTDWSLQVRYPARSSILSAFSSIELGTEAFADRPRVQVAHIHSPRLITVGTLEHDYKGVDVLIRSFADVVGRYPTARLTVIGDGRMRLSLEQLAADIGIVDAIYFAGWISDQRDIRRLVDDSDLFVLASRAEGLPRALIEAMARGIPCVATAVGGTPELLPAELLSPKENSGMLALRILEVLADERLRIRAADHSLRTASKYRKAVLDGRRRNFYMSLRRHVEGRTIG